MLTGQVEILSIKKNWKADFLHIMMDVYKSYMWIENNFFLQKKIKTNKHHNHFPRDYKKPCSYDCKIQNFMKIVSIFSTTQTHYSNLST